MRQSDLDIHARVFARVTERIKAMPESEYQKLALAITGMVAQEYRTIGQISTLDPEPTP